MLLYGLLSVLLLCNVHFTGALKTLVGCLTGKQAISVNEQIMKLLETATLADPLNSLATNTHLAPQIQSCLNKGGSQEAQDLTASMLTAMGQQPSDSRTQFVQTFSDAYKEIVTQLISQAIEVEKTMKEVSDKRVQLVNTTHMFSEIWKNVRKIRLEQERTVESYDMFLKDSIMQKSAKISKEVREGNKESWTVEKVYRELKKTTEKASKIIKDVLAHNSDFGKLQKMMYEIIENYVASQVYSALVGTDLENEMLRELTLIQRFKRFSELTISKSMRTSTRLMYDSLSVGVETIEQYASGVNDTLDKVEQAMQSIDSIAITTSCDDARALARVAGQAMVDQGIAEIRNGPAKDAQACKDELENFIKDNAVPKMQLDIPPADALQVIMRSLPNRGDRKPALNTAYDYLAGFFGNPVDIATSYTLVDGNGGNQGNGGGYNVIGGGDGGGGGYTVVGGGGGGGGYTVVGGGGGGGGYTVVTPSEFGVSPGGGYTVVMGDRPKRQTIVIDSIVTVDQTNQLLHPVKGMVAQPWIEASSHVEHVLKVFQCYRKILQIVGGVIQGCQDGADTFDALYTKYSSAPYINTQTCATLVNLAVPSKSTVKSLLTRAAGRNVLNFNANNCKANKQSDEPGYVPFMLQEDGDDEGLYEASNDRLSASQRHMVCDLKSKTPPLTTAQISTKIGMAEPLVSGVRCLPGQNARRTHVVLPKLMKHRHH